MKERLNPVHVIDVGRGVEAMAYDDHTAGETFELFGPNNYSMRDIMDMVDREILKERRHINLPKPMMMALAKALDFLWWPTISPDEVTRQFIDQVIDPNAKTFADLGIKPDDIERLVIAYVRHYRYVLERYTALYSSNSL